VSGRDRGGHEVVGQVVEQVVEQVVVGGPAGGPVQPAVAVALGLSGDESHEMAAVSATTRAELADRPVDRL
jgi:hypothetical protein